MKDNVCRDCGNTLKGRADRKFCSDACRSHFNNRRYAREKGNFRTIERILHKNRSLLLESLQEKEHLTFNFSELASKGFNPNFFTSWSHHQVYGSLRMCYDIGFCVQEEIGMVYLAKVNPKI